MAIALITGINGFVGKHVAHELHSQGWTIWGVAQDQVVHPEIKDIITNYFLCDLTDYDAVARLPLSEVAVIINLAGLATVGKSFDNPEIYMKVNVGVLSTLCKRIEEIGRKDLRIIAISSGTVYSTDQEMPLTEDSAIDASSSPYSASKLAMEEAALDFRGKGFDCVIARPFNHTGPGQAEGFLLPDLYAKVRSAAGKEILVGNLDTQRDYTDVRDVSRAYAALASQKTLKYAIYNICSGKPIVGTEMLNMLSIVCSTGQLRTHADPNFFRPSDAAVIYGDNSRIKSETGWQPALSLEQTIKDFVAWKETS